MLFKFHLHRFRFLIAFVLGMALCGLLPKTAHAQMREDAAPGMVLANLTPMPQHAGIHDDDYEDTQAKFQATYIWQRHGAFSDRRPSTVNSANYGGAYPLYSLSNTQDKSYTATFTGYFGFRPWAGGELYLNPEVTQGVPFGGTLTGLGGFYNGEITRAAGSRPTLYRQRLFLRQTWNLGGGSEAIESDLNWMAGNVDKNRFVLTAGNFSVLDVFDKNRYAGDPRRQFMNWGNMNNVAFDYAADSRGWGWGAAGEWYQGDWVLRFGRMTGPKRPNELPTDFRIGKHYGDQVEVEHDHDIAGRAGAVRLTAWRNRANLASFRDAINYGNSVGWSPDATNGMEYILNVRNGEKTKYGFGMNIDQEISDNVGVFLKGMWADGRTETYAFAEVDRSLATGVSINGAAWGRANDTLGLSYLAHFLSKDRREYLEKGGISYFIGDGWLNYKPEQIMESYYSAKVHKNLWMTADYQYVRNPAYNADRGPIHIVGVRMHAEF
ncbi:carbohydrate porin [uncultured Propionivibrio sp.]|uniref:carbohydrate porin n=1 Tax=uncultured Propionivibrio sp. TaxID=426737 RepID=UPI0029C0E513|nr:carbohydrate porin [uncultured Propionivibrio sp.]